MLVIAYRLIKVIPIFGGVRLPSHFIDAIAMVDEDVGYGDHPPHLSGHASHVTDLFPFIGIYKGLHNGGSGLRVLLLWAPSKFTAGFLSGQLLLVWILLATHKGLTNKFARTDQRWL